jgi:hypothetical protein
MRKISEAQRSKRRARQKMAVRILARWKQLQGCIDCGYNANPDGLHWDHVRGVKRCEVSACAHSWKTVFDEVDKCEVRCGTCHFIRSAAQNRARRK